MIDELFDTFAVDNYIKKILFCKNRYRKELLFAFHACSFHGYANTSGKGGGGDASGGDASLQRDSQPLPTLA